MTTTTEAAGANPFIGPAPFPRAKALHGREREKSELCHLLLAHRIVLLHSPSGAGKSSLVEAGLLPRMRREGFDVWRTIRVHLDPAALGVPGANAYLASTIASLEEQLPEERRRPLPQLVAGGLEKYLAERPKKRGAEPWKLLIFDQFEEILTLNPVDHAAKKAFFAELGQSLADATFWVLFIVREDHLAALAPYRDLLPTRLAHTFRLDLLDRQAAAEVLEKTAAEGGRSFPAAGDLVDNLAQVMVQQEDGSLQKVAGSYVEPVQLQVVGHRLWASLPVGDGSIDREDLASFGNVDDALADYYTAAVAAAAEGRAIERRIRDFFDEGLITAGGLRCQVQRSAAERRGLHRQHLEALLASHLIRGEKRFGATWYELSHDRLIQPVRASNADWRERHLSVLERRADLWEKSRRSPDLLLEGDDLSAARREAAESAELDTAEKELLEASEKAFAVQEKERRFNRRILVSLQATIVFFLIAAGLGILAYDQAKKAEHAREVADQAKVIAERAKDVAEQEKEKAVEAKNKEEAAKEQARAEEAKALAAKDRADQQTKKALSRSLAAQARDQAGQGLRELRQALLLTATANRLEPTFEARRALLEMLEVTRGLEKVVTAPPGIVALALRAGGSEIAAATAAEVWRLEAATGKVLAGTALPKVTALTYCPDGFWIAGTSDGTLHTAAGKPGRPAASGHQQAISDLFCGPGLLASGDLGGQILLWSTASDSLTPLGSPLKLDYKVKDLAIDASASRLAAIMSGGKVVRVFDLGDPAAPPVDHPAKAEPLAIFFDQEGLAAILADGRMQRWPGSDPIETPAEAGPLQLAVAAAGILAGQLEDGRLCWLGGGRPLTGSRHRKLNLAAAPGFLAAASPDGYLAIWKAEPAGLPGSELNLGGVAYEPTSRQVALGHAKSFTLQELGGGRAGRRQAFDSRHKIQQLAFVGEGLALATKDGPWLFSSANDLRPPPDGTGDLKSLACSRKGNVCLLGRAAGRQTWWRPGEAAFDLTSPEIAGVRASVEAVALTEDAAEAAAAAGKQIFVWDLPRRRLVRELPPRRREVTALAFGPQFWLALGNDQGDLEILDARSGRQLAEMPGQHDKALQQLAFSQDGELLASRDLEGRLLIWFTAELRQKIPLRVLFELPADPRAPIRGLAFGEGHDLLVVREHSLEVRRLGLDSLCRRLQGGGLEAREWRQLVNLEFPQSPACLAARP